MINNDILRRLRFTFDYSDAQSIKLFSLDPNSSVDIDKGDFMTKIAKEEADDFVECADNELCAFLDGLIVLKRGLREPSPAKPGEAVPVEQAKPKEFRLSKNDVLKKLRIAMNYKEQDMLDTLKLGGSDLSKSELGALFRKPDHKHFRLCGNQVLRNFIKGLTIKLRPELQRVED